MLAEVVAPVVSALQGAPVKGRPPLSFGGELDLLAVDTAGRLLTVEVKPKGITRWGDYIALSPATYSGTSAWVAGEYGASLTDSDGKSKDYATWIGNVGS